jgi:DNA-binding NarL/FixJ family response regulator
MAEIFTGDRSARMGNLRRSDGSAFPVLISPAILSDSKGRSTGFSVVVIDFEHVRHSQLDNSDTFFAIQTTLSRMANELRSLNLAALPKSQPLPVGNPDFVDLTPREHEVLTHLASDMRVANISKLLGVAPSTIRDHLKSIYRKWNVNSQPLKERAP